MDIIIFLSFFVGNIIKYSKKKNKHFKTAKNALIFFGATRGFKGKGGFGRFTQGSCDKCNRREFRKRSVEI